MLSLKFQHSFEDLVKANRLMADHSPTMRRMRKFALILIGIIFFLLGILNGISISSNSVLINPVIILSPIVLYLLVIQFLFRRLFHWSAGWSFKRMLRETSNQALFSEREVTVDDQGIIAKSGLGESKFQWRGIDRVVESEEFALFYISSVQAITVPMQKVISGNPKRFVEAAKEYWLAANPGKVVEEYQ
ncbi:MAG: YcxB family protein [Planctomycetaceae bacterium]|nr:YcxB family protein [Planctomycetaceae bacterium]